MASYYVSKSKSRWGDLFSHTKSGIACISGSEVYSLHKHLDLSHVRSSTGRCEEKATRDLEEDEKNNSQEDIKQPICPNEEQIDKTHNSLLSDQHFRPETDPLEREIDSLRGQIFAVRANNQELESQLVINQGLKDQESTLTELQIVAERKSAKIELLGEMLESLETENRRLKDLAADREALNTEMELAKMKMTETRKQIQKRWRKKNDAMNNLRQQFACQRGRMDAMVRKEEEMKKMVRKEEEMKKMIEGLRAKIVELKRSNLGIVNDKIELLNKMDSVKEGMIIEKKAAKKALEEPTRLRISNGELAKQVEMYRSERQEDVQELVYLRRINACLIYELQKKHRPREMNSIKKERKGVNVVVGVENEVERKCNAYDIDCSSANTEIEAIDSSRDWRSIWMSAKKAKPKLIEKIKKWGDTKASHQPTK